MFFRIIEESEGGFGSSGDNSEQWGSKHDKHVEHVDPDNLRKRRASPTNSRLPPPFQLFRLPPAFLPTAPTTSQLHPAEN